MFQIGGAKEEKKPPNAQGGLFGGGNGSKGIFAPGSAASGFGMAESSSAPEVKKEEPVR